MDLKQKISDLVDFLKAKTGMVQEAIIAVLVAAVGVLIYIVQNKQAKLNAINAQVQLADTQQKADVLEANINQLLSNKTLIQKEVDGLNQALVALQQKRTQIATQSAQQTDQQAVDYWNKK